MNSIRSPMVRAAVSIPRSFASALGLAGLTRTATTAAAGMTSCSNSSLFAINGTENRLTPVTFSLGRFRLVTSPVSIGSEPLMKTIRDCRGRCLRRLRGRKQGGGDHNRLTANQIGRQCRQLIIFSVRPMELDFEVPAFHKSVLLQASAKFIQAGGIRIQRSLMQESDHGHRPLLRARRERYGRSRATGERDELA